MVHLLGNREAGVSGSGVPNYKNKSTVPACPKFNIQDRKELVSDLERAMNFEVEDDDVDIENDMLD